jgi:hypothetical protein
LAEGEAYAVFVACVAASDDAEVDEFFEARASELAELVGGLVERGCALDGIEFTPFEEEMGVGVDEAGEERVGGEVGIGSLLFGIEKVAGRRLFAGEEYLILVVDEVGIAQGRGAEAVEQRADAEPDVAVGCGGDGVCHFRSQQAGLRRKWP